MRDSGPVSGRGSMKSSSPKTPLPVRPSPAEMGRVHRDGTDGPAPRRKLEM